LIPSDDERPINKTLALVAQRNGSGQYDIHSMPAGGGRGRDRKVPN
jgi:hypothetical protein